MRLALAPAVLAAVLALTACTGEPLVPRADVTGLLTDVQAVSVGERQLPLAIDDDGTMLVSVVWPELGGADMYLVDRDGSETRIAQDVSTIDGAINENMAAWLTAESGLTVYDRTTATLTEYPGAVVASDGTRLDTTGSPFVLVAVGKTVVWDTYDGDTTRINALALDGTATYVDFDGGPLSFAVDRCGPQAPDARVTVLTRAPSPNAGITATWLEIGKDGVSRSTQPDRQLASGENSDFYPFSAAPCGPNLYAFVRDRTSDETVVARFGDSNAAEELARIDGLTLAFEPVATERMLAASFFDSVVVHALATHETLEISTADCWHGSVSAEWVVWQEPSGAEDEDYWTPCATFVGRLDLG